MFFKFNGQTNKKGFTLLELLIVIAILATLAVIIVLVLNPAETLKKARDVQRMSDLSTLKTAVGLILTSSTTPLLSGTAGNSLCYGGTTPTIWYSLPSSSAITDPTLDGGTGSNPIDSQVGTASTTLTDGTGWIPINFDWLPGGSPISNLPVDPTNTIADLTAVVNTDLVYRYACKKSNTTFEVDARLESNAFTVDDNKMASDGGNNSNYYETGTNLKILGTGTDF